jgi:hypothetical protein
MRKSRSKVTRRDFIKGAGCAAVGVAVGLPVLAEETHPPLVDRSRVVLIRHKDAVSAEGKVNADLVQLMLDEAVAELFGQEKAIDNWKKIIWPEDIVGIKSNEYQTVPTPKEVERAILKRVLEVGVPEKHIAIEDRGVRDNEIFQRSTALINTRPMRTHAWSGVGGLIKNYITFGEHWPDYHDDACAPLGKVWELPMAKGKTRLNVLVMLSPVYHTPGPHQYDPAYVWNYNGLIVSTDPVAADSIGLRIIQQKRKLAFGDNRPLQPTAHHIAIADTRYHLGNSDMSRIELIRKGWDVDCLI